MKKSVLSRARAAVAGLLVLLPLAAHAGQATPVPGRIVVGFRTGTAPAVAKSAGQPRTGLAGVDAVLSRHGATMLEPLFGKVPAKAGLAAQRDLERFYVLECDATAGNDAVIAELLSLPEVESAESDLLLRQAGTAYLPNDLSASQWHLRNVSAGGGDIRAIGGWAESLGDSNVVVAVVDSGVDYLHPDLGGAHPDKVNGAIKTNWEEYYGSPGVDDDSNGYIDDIRGWDFVNVSPSLGWPGEDVVGTDNDPMDFGGHGTMVAGCVAPLTNNGIGVAAAAPGCKILPVRIGFQNVDGEGVSYATFMASAFMYATNNDADIINLSYGTGYLLAFANAINFALNNGVVICVAAGNEGDDVAGYLQGLSDDRILAVAATGAGDTKTSFSSYGSWVDVSAPGEGIYTTAYNSAAGTHIYESTQGTSFSSPIVAGACALIWSAHPEFTSAQVAALVQSSADPIDALNPGYEGLLGSGRVNLLAALGDNVHLYPQEFPSLFDAMNGAAAGDTVKVRGDTVLPSPLTVFGKGLKIFGGYDASYTTRNLVDGHTLLAGGAGVQLTFSGAITATTEFDGFEITGGTGQNMTVLAPNTRTAGGVLLNQVSPILRNCRITGNSVGGAGQLGCGGGVALLNSSAVLEDCVISGNTGIYGAGVFASGGSPSLVRCTIANNTLIGTNATYPPRGGGVHASDSNLQMVDCTVSGHLDADLGGGIYGGGVSTKSNLAISGGAISGNTARTGGGGIHQTGGSLDLAGTLVENNGKSATATFMYGGGVQATGGALVSIDGVTCRGNQAQVGGGIALGACGASSVSNSVLSGNTGVFWAGGLFMDSCPGSSISGNTIYGNTGLSAGGGGAYVANCTPTITRNISAGNLGAATYGNGFALSNAAVSPTCNDVFGNQNGAWTGIANPTGTAGNVAVDPLFCDAAGGNFQLQSSSPCRPENSGACGQVGALLGSCYVSPVPGDETMPAVFRVEQNFPNPFNPKTTIRFALPAAARTSVSIFDVAGRHVKTLIDEELEARVHDVTWLGDDAGGRPVAAGIYFYEVSGGGHRAVGRMALVK